MTYRATGMNETCKGREHVVKRSNACREHAGHFGPHRFGQLRSARLQKRGRAFDDRDTSAQIMRSRSPGLGA